MLLFIAMYKIVQIQEKLFQYITCYSLSILRIHRNSHFCCFNTSHVTVYQILHKARISQVCVSIHHMLLFIREHLQGSTGMVRVSIHHMLLFIRLRKNCISISSRFNTSHVTLYRCTHRSSGFLKLVSIHHMLLFIMEEETDDNQRNDVSIHHMLLFIDLQSISGKRRNKVSIHHMLLFIVKSAYDQISIFGFQYITCYSLSKRGSKERKPDIVSIHHMLLFIPRFIGILSIHMSNNTPKPKEFQYFYQALLEILYF